MLIIQNLFISPIIFEKSCEFVAWSFFECSSFKEQFLFMKLWVIVETEELFKKLSIFAFCLRWNILEGVLIAWIQLSGDGAQGAYE